jgi:hypothetical protein
MMPVLCCLLVIRRQQAGMDVHQFFFSTALVVMVIRKGTAA